MSWVRDLYYTPLIDSDVKAYEQFVVAVQAHFRDGSTAKFSSEQLGSADRQQYNGCLNYPGCCANCPVARLVVAAPCAPVGAAGGCSVFIGQHGSAGDSPESQQQCGQRTGGLSVDSVDCFDSGACGDICGNSVSGERPKDSENGNGSLGASLSEEAGGWGRWHSSNVKKRVRRRAKRVSSEKQLLMQRSWRSGADVVVSDSDHLREKGFFSMCDDDVKKNLRDSRARMLIAQNNLRAEKAKKNLDAMGSVQGVVQQMLDVTSSVAKLQKQTTDEAVHGWARTVASTMAKTITESSSSVPTLESIGFGASGLKSTDGEVLDPVRVAAFDRDMKYVEDSFASMDSYSEEDYKLAVRRVKLDFPDVAFTKAQREVAASKAVAVQRLLELGVDYNKIQEAIYPDGE